MLDQKIIPLKTYPGRKGAAGAWQQIISEIPKCDLFIDAMCGSGFIASLVTGCKRIVNDIDRSVIAKIDFTAEDITFSNRHYSYVIDKYDREDHHAVFYFDPPYLMTTRSYKEKIYKHDWNLYDHKDFLKAVKKISSPVIISHYPCSLYDKALKNWRRITYKTMTRAGVRDECIYMNFPQPVLLQCYNHVGLNFTDRQRIKRKVQRLISRLNNEDAKERAAILSGIIDNYNYVISNPLQNNLEN